MRRHFQLTQRDQFTLQTINPDLAILDHVSFRGGEYELPVGDVDLPAAEIHGVHAMLHRTNNVFGIILPREHVGVGHARHRNVFVTLAPAIPGIGDPHELRREFVAEVALENAILNENRLLRGLTFVIDVQ